MKQLAFKKVSGWGGKRRGSGRKNRTREVSHAARPEVSAKTPVHITQKLKKGFKGLRTHRMKRKFERCLHKAQSKGLKVLHFSLQTDHLHFFVECAGNDELAKGMNSLGVSFGRAIRKRAGGKGKVFHGRYHMNVLTTPTQMRNALAYVLLNRAKHMRLKPYRDEFSSGGHFQDWQALTGHAWKIGSRPLPDHLHPPESWLARKGWRRASITETDDRKLTA